MDIIIVLDFGGQYSHLIARRIRDLGVYSEIFPFDVNLEMIKKVQPKGIIFSGGPSSIYEKNSPKVNDKFFELIQKEKIPILGICYGFHLIAHQLGGKIEPKDNKEFGKTNLKIIENDLLFESLEKEEIV